MEDWRKRPAETPDGDTVMVGPEGKNGICCAEMDILEANREAGVYTAHPCQYEKTKVCSKKEECGDKQEGYTGWCDKDGCGFNPYRVGHNKFWGVGSDFAVDTSKPMTVVTQFITSDNTDSGDLVEIRRFYVQDGKVIENPSANADLVEGGGNSVTDSLCDAQNEAFNASSNGFKDLGGLKAMGGALGRGMSLAMSIWDDDMGRMLWLDGEKAKYDEDLEDPGVQRGPCAFDYGTNKDMKAAARRDGDIEVTFTNVKYGEIGSTFSASAATAAAKQSAATKEFEVISDSSQSAGRTTAPKDSLAKAILAAGALTAVVFAMAVAGLRSSRAARSSASSHVAKLLPSSDGQE